MLAIIHVTYTMHPHLTERLRTCAPSCAAHLRLWPAPQADILRRTTDEGPSSSRLELAEDIVRAGNLSRAVRGVARFPALQVFAPPGDYEIEVSPFDSRRRPLTPGRLRLRLRRCVAGEAAEELRAAGGQEEDPRLAVANVSIKCRPCMEGTVSLDPYAKGGCIRCDDGSHSNCTGYAKMPNKGWWHSHPRSPLVHRCLLDRACAPNHTQMQAWAAKRRQLSIRQLAPAEYQEYVDMQCAEGYQVGEDRGGGMEEWLDGAHIV